MVPSHWRSGGPITLAPYAADAAPSAWTVTLSADAANTALAITAASDSSTNRWVATVRTTEESLLYVLGEEDFQEAVEASESLREELAKVLFERQ